MNLLVEVGVGAQAGARPRGSLVLHPEGERGLMTLPARVMRANDDLQRTSGYSSAFAR